MTADTFTMESIYLLKRPDLVLKTVRRLSSAKRNEQLQNIIVRSDELSLSYKVHIQMLIGPKGEAQMYYDSFQVPELLLGNGVTLVVQRCLKLMDKMAGGDED